MGDAVLLAVNGTLMRGLELNGNLVRAPEITPHGGWRAYLAAKRATR